MKKTLSNEIREPLHSGRIGQLDGGFKIHRKYPSIKAFLKSLFVDPYTLSNKESSKMVDKEYNHALTGICKNTFNSIGWNDAHLLSFYDKIKTE